MVLSGYTRTRAKKLQKNKSMILKTIATKNKKVTGIKTLDALH